MTFFEGFGAHTLVQFNIFLVLYLFKGYELMFCLKICIVWNDNLKELSDVLILLFSSILFSRLIPASSFMLTCKTIHAPFASFLSNMTHAIQK